MGKIEITETEGGSDKTVSVIDLGIEDLPPDVRSDIIERAGEFLIEQVLASLSGAKSPVSGEIFPALSKKYKEFKTAQGGSSRPDLELYGNMKNALTYKSTSSGLELGFFGSESGKADGHNNFSGDSSLPQRRFLPAEGQVFKKSIMKGLESIVNEGVGDALTKSDLSSVESSKDLYDVLRGVYGSMPRSAIREAVASSANLMDILIDLELVGYL